jgi:hypothetical protein
MPTLLPQRNYNDHDVYNQFKFNPTGTYPALKGTFVKVLSGLMTDQQIIALGSVGAAWSQTVSQRYGVQPSVATCTSSGDAVLGMLLYDVRETDENGERLIYHPDKQDKMQATLSGLPVPIVTRGMFVYSGVEGTLPAAPRAAYLGINGGITISGSATSTATKVGQFLGPADANGIVYLKLEL